MSYTSISPHTVTLLHTTHTHTSPHQDTHSAFLSSCHPPAKNTGGKHHSTLGNKLIHMSGINFLTGSEQKASDSAAALLPREFHENLFWEIEL